MRLYYANTRSLILRCLLSANNARKLQSYVLLWCCSIFSCNICQSCLLILNECPKGFMKAHSKHQLLTHTIFHCSCLHFNNSFHFCVSGCSCVSSPWPLASFCSVNANIAALFFQRGKVTIPYVCACVCVCVCVCVHKHPVSVRCEGLWCLLLCAITFQFVKWLRHTAFAKRDKNLHSIVRRLKVD